MEDARRPRMGAQDVHGVAVGLTLVHDDGEAAVRGESGAIEQDADEVMFLYREDYYNKDTPEQNVAECIVAKNRHGETGTVKLQWLPQFTTFADREWRHDEG